MRKLKNDYLKIKYLDYIREFEFHYILEFYKPFKIQIYIDENECDLVLTASKQ